MPGRLTHDRCCDLAEAEIARFARALAGVDPATPVPTCGGWTMADLVQHVGHVHRWAAGMVAVLAGERHGRNEADLPLPPDPADHPGWVLAGGRTLLAALRAADADAPMWAWGPDEHVRFWSRRMVHETAVHRCDAELAAGREPAVDEEVAADGVAELLENLPARREVAGAGERISLRATDAGHRWTIRFRPSGFDWSEGGSDDVPASVAVTVAAPTSDLYLLLWGRRPADDGRLDVTGDRALLTRWQAEARL